MVMSVRKCATADLQEPTDEELAADRALAAEWLERCRKHLDLTYAQMAKRLGRDASTWYRWESGTTAADFDVYPRIRAMLEAAGIDSQGKLLAARAV